MKRQFLRRQKLLLALPFVLGVGLWQAPHYMTGSATSYVGTFDNDDIANDDIAMKTAVRELALLMQFYPRKTHFAVSYIVLIQREAYTQQELSYDTREQLLNNTITKWFKFSVPAQRLYRIHTTPEAIFEAAEMGELPSSTNR